MSEPEYYLSTNEKQFTATNPGAWMNITDDLSINIFNALYIQSLINQRTRIGLNLHFYSNRDTSENICPTVVGQKDYKKKNLFCLP